MADLNDAGLRAAVTKARDNAGMAVVKMTLLSGTKGASPSDKKVLKAVCVALDEVVKELNAALALPPAVQSEPAPQPPSAEAVAWLTFRCADEGENDHFRKCAAEILRFVEGHDNG